MVLHRTPGQPGSSPPHVPAGALCLGKGRVAQSQQGRGGCQLKAAPFYQRGDRALEGVALPDPQQLWGPLCGPGEAGAQEWQMEQSVEGHQVGPGAAGVT